MGLGKTPLDCLPLRRHPPRRRALAQTAQRATGDPAQLVEITQYQLDRSERFILAGPVCRLPCPQEQQRIRQHQLTGTRRSVARVQLADLARRELLTGDHGRKLLGVRLLGARQRHQILHRRVGSDLAPLHTLLDLFGKLSYQTQPTADPAGTAIKAHGQLLHRQLETTVKLGQQPRLLKGALTRSMAHRPAEQQRVGFSTRPAQSSHRVAPQPPKGPHALVAVHHDVALSDTRGDNHDRQLLTRLGQGSHQPARPSRATDSQLLVAQLQLVKLQVHGVLVSTWSLAAHRPSGRCRLASIMGDVWA